MMLRALQIKPDFAKPGATKYKYFYVDANQVSLLTSGSMRETL
jgi:hypothetical protein